MNFGQGVYNFLKTNIEGLALGGILLAAVYFCWERKISKIIGLIVVGIVAAGFIFATTDVKGILVDLFRNIFL